MKGQTHGVVWTKTWVKVDPKGTTLISRIRRGAIIALALLQVLMPVLPAIAAFHPLSGVTDKNADGIQDLDITVSLNWDPATASADDDDPRGLTTDEFTTVIKSFAASVFSTTNGLHRLRNVFVFKNGGYAAMADIRYSKSKGGDAARVSAWKKKSGQIYKYVYDDESSYVQDPSPGASLGHEAGHYIYGVYDEYKNSRKDGKKIEDLSDQSDPATDDDGTQESIMNQHATYKNWFSVDSGYGTEAKKNTAQYRVFGKSIWGTLASDPAGDAALAREDKRTWFDAFKNKAVSAVTANQTTALAGYDKTLNIVYVPETVYTVLVLDSSMPTARWSAALEACKGAIRGAKNGGWMTILRGNSVVADRKQLTDTAKTDLVSQVSDLAQGASATVESSLTEALARVRNHREKSGYMTSVVHLLTAGSSTAMSSQVKDFADAKAGLITTSMADGKASTPGTGRLLVTELSELTGGSATLSKTAQGMESKASRSARRAESDGLTDIAKSHHPGSLVSGQSHTLSFTMGTKDDALEVAFFAADGEFAKLQPTLTDPHGTVLTDATVAAGFSAEADSDSGEWIFRVERASYAPSANGIWTAGLKAAAAVAEPLAIVASARSSLSLSVSVEENPLYGYVVEASLSAVRPVLDARVTAAVYDTDGNELAALILKDDGLNGDVRKDDGIYTARITPLPAEGEYEIVAWADDNGVAVESDRGMRFSSANAATTTATGAFERTDENAFTYSLTSSRGTRGMCFIAEAAYGTALHPHVGDLRQFRDKWLLTSGLGRLLVRFYYSWSPDAAAFIREHDTARIAARVVLTTVVYSVCYPLLPVAAVVMIIALRTQRRWLAFLNEGRGRNRGLR